MKEVALEIKQQEHKKGKLRLLRDVDSSFYVNDSILYINVFVASLDNGNLTIDKSKSYKVWLGKEKTYFDILNQGLGRINYAKELYEKNKKVRFVLPKKRKDFIGDWEVLGENDVVKTSKEEIISYLVQLKKEQEDILVKVKRRDRYSV